MISIYASSVLKYMKDVVYFLVFMNKSEHLKNIECLFMVLLKHLSVHMLHFKESIK